ncbi:related to endoglucanase [Phialocephala subalpina]|uniref:Related to endoglucanase n=1 Tax=Phialocephala subalpina TaxID=576137 RepID=A0A1L7XCB3_9HELO|nr:related to endoglucanase [Phialocephala subalpina]
MAPSLEEPLDSQFVAPSKQRNINSILHVSGSDVLDGDGKKVVLKGVGLGGVLNQENFITGFSGQEHEHRESFEKVLGKEKADFYFDRLLNYLFSDKDAAFFASLGLNCVRLPFNYRHFEDDLNPGVIKEEGFRLLDRIINHCTKHGLYVILDLHTAPGGQNQDWHCDSGLTRALFWKFKDFQDRVVNLWVKIAERYRGNPVIAGYNPLNEPADPDHVNLIAFYDRIEKAIRAVDPEHILFIDGNTYSMDFTHFPTKFLPNAVYACHDYSTFGFPRGHIYDGTEEQKAKLRRSFERKVQYMRETGTPIWNGEFGPVYASSEENGETAEVVNARRFSLLREQIAIYRESDIHWNIWLYKDIGYQGMVYVDPKSPYMQLIAPFLAKKQKLCLDFWGCNDDQVKHIYDPFLKALKEMVPEHLQKSKYPSPLWSFERHFERVVREGLLSEYITWEMAELFVGKTDEELDILAGSFKFENCLVREELNKILSEDALRGINSK